MPEVTRSKVPDSQPLDENLKFRFDWLIFFNDLNKRSCRVQDNYANDAAAAAGGIQIGQEYHNAGIKRIRIA